MDKRKQQKRKTKAEKKIALFFISSLIFWVFLICFVRFSDSHPSSESENPIATTEGMGKQRMRWKREGQVWRGQGKPSKDGSEGGWASMEGVVREGQT